MLSMLAPKSFSSSKKKLPSVGFDLMITGVWFYDFNTQPTELFFVVKRILEITFANALIDFYKNKTWLHEVVEFVIKASKRDERTLLLRYQNINS